jgi:hypothetical protein
MEAKGDALTGYLQILSTYMAVLELLYTAGSEQWGCLSTEGRPDDDQ